MYDGVFGGSPMGSFNLCNHISNTTACTYQLNENRQLSILRIDYDTCRSVVPIAI
ncbi:hypothetical protein GCM10025857_30340 [Alicyclobacillus contaminans]|nr:hypothetical protein GCM10025857_30290 [Alicyclobacillus contaminans]GMA51677.1 hypothetical protein GCM10025857_30340 [Alicyclobacillus contaminans]